MLIDVDDPLTWPAPVTAAVHKVAEFLGSKAGVGDLRIGPDEDGAFRMLLAPHRVLAYHVTRLLPHEEVDIRQQGLRVLTPALLADRLAAAYSHGAIDAEQRDALATATVFHDGGLPNNRRSGSVHGLLSRRSLDDAPGLKHLLSIWGGEGIYKSSDGYALRPMLKTLGIPSIVVFGIDLSVDWTSHRVSPGVLHSFVGSTLQPPAPGASINYRNSIPPDQIVEIWQPGHPDFARHAALLEAIHSNRR